MITSQLLPLANHLWQTTLFAAVAGLLTLLLRRNGAQIRYCLWLSASVKFLIPLSTLVVVGGLLGRHATATIARVVLISPGGLSSAIEQVGEPFAATATQFTALPGGRWSHVSVIVPVLIAIWAVGFAILVYRWVVLWRRMRMFARTASPLHVPIGVPVKSSPGLREPGVFGILRPALLLPDGIVDCLTTREMDAIVAHELCHIRRRDNLTTAIHMAVEALFWFHPLVWWVGSRLMAERERACDEEVLRNGGDPHAYAEGILKTCEFYLASPLACVSGVTGGNLKRRIEAIISNRAIPGLNYTRKAVLTVAAMISIAMPIGIGIVRTPQADAQSSVPASSDMAEWQEAHASILTEGWHTTPAEASRLESGLIGDPHNVSARTRLISYYYQQMMAEPRTRHILWLIENHPEAQIFQFASDVAIMSPNWTNLNSDSGWDRARALWLRQAERFPNSTLILSNAAQALPIDDSIRLMRRVRVLEPDKLEWTVNLAMVYARAVRDACFNRNRGDGRRQFAGSRKYRETPLMRLPMATPATAERMQSELETSTDASLIGVTGELLVEAMGLLREPDGQTPEIVNSADFGRRLLERARILEPNNPRWRQ